MRLFLARHGQTDWNAEHRLQGQADRPLTPLGRAQAEALCDLLRHESIQAIYASPLQRARDTAAPLARARGLTVEPRQEMLEIDYGILEGHTRESVSGTDLEEVWMARKHDPLLFDAPGGETYSVLLDRVRPFAEELQRRHAHDTIAHDTIVVVGHRASNRALLAVLLGRTLPEVVKLKQKNTDVLEIQPHGDPELRTHRTRDIASSTEKATRGNSTGGNP